MKVKVKELLRVISDLKPGISTKGVLEQASHIIFMEDKVATYNGRISISVPFDTSFSFSVDGAVLYSLLDKMKGDEVDIYEQEGKLVLKGDKTECELNGMEEGAGYTAIKDLNSNKVNWKELPEDFLEGVKLNLFSVTKDVTSVLNCIDVKDDVISSSDNFRISSYLMKDGIKDELLLPLSFAEQLVSYDIISYGLDESWMHFKTESGVIFSGRRVEMVDFPDVSSFFEVTGEEVVLPKDAPKSVSLVSGVVEEDFEIDNKIDVKVRKGELIYRGESNKGWAETKDEIVYEGEEFSFSINPSFFIDILHRGRSFIFAEDKLLFLVDNFKHLVALCEEG